MKRIALTWVLAIASLLGLSISDTALANVNNFTITSFDVQMELGRDDQQRSILRTVETISANFPPNQNQGLERVFVKNYNDHPTSFQLVSVTDGAGQKLNYHWSGDALRIGEQGVYVSGPQTYRITYTQRDVTRAYQDTGRDEFYWDIVGTSWRVPILNFSYQLTVDPALADAIETELFCYQGQAGSNLRCDVEKGPTGVYQLALEQLQPRQGATVALGFAPGTFAEYQPGLWFYVIMGWLALQLALLLIGVVWVVNIFVKRHRKLNRTAEQQTVVTEYLPPDDISVTAAAELLGSARSVSAAQLLDLAVRHYIKLYQVKEARWYSSAEYEIEVIKPIDDLKWEEKELLSDKFGHEPKPGDRLNLKLLQNNKAYYLRLQNNSSGLDQRVRGEYQLEAKDEPLEQSMRRSAKLMLILGGLTVSPVLLLLSAIVYGSSYSNWRLTDRGLAVRRHLSGLKQYIEVAETERLKLLQSPEGAQKVATLVDGVDTPAQRIVLYERVLPYAVLFGQEKQWGQQLGDYYEQAQAQPDWYTGQQAGAFNAAALGSAISGLGTTMSSVDGSSSGSGGSSGGGSVGGGGGGGGGGGW